MRDILSIDTCREAAGAQPAARVSPREKLLDPSEVATWLGVSAGWVRDHATRKQPRLPAVKLGKLLRFRPQDVEEFIRLCSQ